MITKETLNSRLHHLVARTPRGDALVRTDPRQLPRRLRVLLLAIDGGQTVQLYVQTLKGFGDVAELLVELTGLGLVTLVDPASQSRGMAKPEFISSHYSALDLLLDDSRFTSKVAADALYGATAPGSFDEMLRVAKIEVPDFVPKPASAPAPVSPVVQKMQIESVFNLLDAVRGERKNLKAQLAKMERMRMASARIENDNKRLTKYVYALGTTCAALCVVIAMILLRR